MAKTSIYLPDDLAEQVRAHGIPVSEVAQAALRQAVKDAEIKESVMTDIQAVADRMKGILAADEAAAQAAAAQVRERGVRWAREHATAAELEYLVTYDGRAADFQAPKTMILTWRENAKIPFDPRHAHWAEFRAGAREIWEEVKPLLIGIDEYGGTVSPEEGYASVISPEHRLWALRESAPDAPAEEHDRWMAEEPEEFRG